MMPYLIKEEYEIKKPLVNPDHQTNSELYEIVWCVAVFCVVGFLFTM
jgi:hypothetical protein